jgi:adenylosuccinate synthase
MSVMAVVGMQWGDEAKGKFVDYLGEQAKIIARYNGGDNAGHTVMNPLGTFKLRLMPSGIFNAAASCVIGAGVVINLATILDEIRLVQQAGIDLEQRLWISPRCHVVMPYHPLVESIYETAKGQSRTGTTGRGMGPVYADKVSYNGIRLFDLADESVLAEKLRVQLAVKNPLFKAFGLPALDLNQVLQEKLAQYQQVAPYVRDPFGMIQQALAQGQEILLEGAQGSLLDNDWGTYPFCTASTTLAGGASAGLGIAPRWIQRVVGVAKAYTSRVGAGPMPSELFDEDGETLRREGQEYGTVTGRPRRCGWFDAEVVRFTAQLNGVTELALTKLDVLDSLPVIKIGIGYHLEGEEEQSPAHSSGGNLLRHYWEGDAHWLGDARPEYLEMPGWQQPTRGLQDFDRLPPAAQAYVHKVEELVGVPITMVATGPEREDVIRRSGG